MARPSLLLTGWHDHEWIETLPKPRPDGTTTVRRDGGTWDPDSPAGMILSAVKSGNFLETAAEFASVSTDVIHKWLRRAKAAKPKAKEYDRRQVPERERAFVDFFRAFAQAEAQAEVRSVGIWVSSDDWRAHRDFLARRQPRWRETVEVGGPDGGPIPIATLDMARLIAEDPEARRASSLLLAKLAGSTPPALGVDPEDAEADDDDDDDVDEPAELS